MKRYLVALLVTTFVGFGYAHAQDEPPGPPMHRPHMDRGDIFAKLELTDDQKEQMKNLKFDTEKKEIELRSKLALSKLELGRLVMSEAPDKAAIEKRINEVAVNESALKINKLNGWFEANKNLTPEQQKVWREFLHTQVMKAAARERKENMCREPRP
jgi:Spy/CpxP family protein refolding chaperone